MRTPLSEYPLGELLTEIRVRRDKMELTLRGVNDLLGDSKLDLVADRILRTAAKQFGVTVEQITGPERGTMNVSTARQMAMAAMRASGKTLDASAVACGRSDHAAVSYAVKRVAVLVETDWIMATRWEVILGQVRELNNAETLTA
jgi:chromosomal replication initiation ATPase DnaA